MTRIIYYVCSDCNMYHGERKKPAQCRRCGSTKLERVRIDDPDFNLVMGVVQKIRKEKKER